MFFKKKPHLTEEDVRKIFQEENAKQQEYENFRAKYEGEYVPPTVHEIFPKLNETQFFVLKRIFLDLAKDEWNKSRGDRALCSFYLEFPKQLETYLRALKAHPEWTK